jgi:hypothetical protein
MSLLSVQTVIDEVVNLAALQHVVGSVYQEYKDEHNNDVMVSALIKNVNIEQVEKPIKALASAAGGRDIYLITFEVLPESVNSLCKSLEAMWEIIPLRTRKHVFAFTQNASDNGVHTVSGYVAY